MSNQNEESFKDNVGFLKYRIEELEKLVKPLIELVNSLDKKVSLLAQKIVIATVLIGSGFQVAGIWYSAHLSDKYSEKEKLSYYEKRVQESDTINMLKAEIENLRKEIK